MTECWKPVDGFPQYEVSSYGRVKSYHNLRGRLLRPDLSFGYQRVTLVRANRTKQRFFVHRLVAFAFHGTPADPSYVVAHLDGDSTNNHADNLRWMSHEENCSHKDAHGTLRRGTEIQTCKLCEADVVNIRQRARLGESCRALSKEYGVASSTVARIVRGELWRWAGSWEEFEDPYLGGPEPSVWNE